MHVSERRLELTTLVVQISQVEDWFKEIVCRTSTLLEVVLGLLNIAFAQFEDAQIVVRFCML